MRMIFFLPNQVFQPTLQQPHPSHKLGPQAGGWHERGNGAK
jgi:hypothetical protein